LLFDVGMTNPSIPKGAFMRTSLLAAVVAMGLFLTPAPAQAQMFLTPFAGVTTGKDSPGERPTGGASVLFMGNVAGLELDFGYTPDFFNDSADFDFISGSNVTSLSANLLIGLGAGPVRPYVTGGVGLLRSSISSADDFFDDVSENDLGVNVGAGLIGMFSPRVGLRGDVRYFRGLQNIDAGELAVSLDDFDFFRAYVGVAFRF
jgi:hypothetical protein